MTNAKSALEARIFEEARKTLSEPDARFLAQRLASMTYEERDAVFHAAFLARA
jgi:hypothetical protein